MSTEKAHHQLPLPGFEEFPGFPTGLLATSTPPDPVNSPDHYTDGGIETIDFIEAKGLNFHLGNAVKYISRAGKKGTGTEKQDIEKAIWYLTRYKETL